MNSRIFAKTLSASAAILLSASISTSALAAENLPATDPSLLSTTAAEISQYKLFYTDPIAVADANNTWNMSANFYWVNEGGDYGIPAGFSFELVSSSPELNASINPSTGDITVVLNQKLDLNKQYNYTVKVTAPDGSTTTEVIPFDAQAVTPDNLANDYSPLYQTGSSSASDTQSDLSVGSSWTTQTLQLADSSLLSQIKDITVTSSDSDILASVDKTTGALTLTNNNPESKWDISSEVSVVFTYKDGSTDTVNVHFNWDAGYTIAEQFDAWYAGAAASPVEAGKTYEAQPVFLDLFDAVESSALPVGTVASLTSADPALNATIDPATGIVQIHFDQLPEESTTYHFLVRFTYSDASFDEIKSSYSISVNGQSPTQETTSTPAPHETATDSAPAISPEDKDGSSTTDTSSAATGEPGTLTNESSSASDPSSNATLVLESNSNGSFDTSLAESQISLTPSTYSNQTSSSQESSVLASTGAKNALLIFFAGLVALGLGSMLVIRRKH